MLNKQCVPSNHNPILGFNDSSILRLARALTICLLMFVIGCSANHEDLWQDYAMRLENVFTIDIQPSTESPLLTLPPRRDRQWQLTPPQMNLWSFLKLYECEVNALIAKKNGPMGKAMLPSQSFLHALLFVPKAKSCLALPDINEDSRQALTQAIAFYERNSIKYLHNALFHEEWEKAFHGHPTWPMDHTYPSHGIPQLNDFIVIMDQLQDQQSIDPQLSNNLEQNLKALSDSRYPGNWLRHIQQAQRHLDGINQALREAQTVCPMGKANRQSDIMNNVFRLHFSGKIQPWVSQLYRFGQAFDPQLKQLSTGQPAMEAFYERLFTDPSGPWQRFNQAWQSHVKLWQNQLGACQLMPSGPVKTP